MKTVQGAVATDDYTSHLWTREEVEGGLLIHGHAFFDYKGWHDERAG